MLSRVFKENSYGDGGRKGAWVVWERVCHSKEEGSLGVKDIKTFNNALL